MKIYRRTWSQIVPTPLDEVWDFFSHPSNLKEITPKDMHFKFLTDLGDQAVYPGMMILHQVSPMLGIKMTWATEITQVKEKEYFVDEQRSGPFAMWHHEHHFKAHGKETGITDLLHYAIPLGPIGTLAHGIFVKKQIEEIFSFREKIIDEYFKKNLSRFEK